ncbi:MAG: class I SAM-dependent methyltransferase [Candidatus Aenigmarchaeota archaeon]|nr:class I SAM-dependent methyltransferase [Candidatus Aenigmarchaeota archaeon]
MRPGLDRYDAALFAGFERYCRDREKRQPGFTSYYQHLPVYRRMSEHPYGLFTKLLLDEFGSLEGRTVVDIGAGGFWPHRECFYAGAVLGLGGAYIGADPNPRDRDAADLAAREKVAGYRFLKGSTGTARAELGDASADAVTTVCVIGFPTQHAVRGEREAHRTLLQGFVRDVAALLRPGGITAHYLPDDPVRWDAAGLLPAALFTEAGLELEEFSQGPFGYIIGRKPLRKEENLATPVSKSI